jgi:hypothetical protein
VLLPRLLLLLLVLARAAALFLRPGAELLADYCTGDDAFWDAITANTQQCNYAAADRQQLEVRAGTTDQLQQLPGMLVQWLVCCVPAVVVV